MNMRARIRRAIWCAFGSPDRDRLASSIAETRITLDIQLQGVVDATLAPPWMCAAVRNLEKAERALADGDIQQGWVALQSAQRWMLVDPSDPTKLERTAIVLRQEADKVSGWRAKAITDLICDPSGNLLSINPNNAQRVIDAVALRDDQFNTTYFKIALRRRHLFNVFLLLLSAIGLSLVLAWNGLLPRFSSDSSQVFASDTAQLVCVIFFGVLGASVSVAQSLLSTDISAKVPAQQIGAFVVWMRPAIGGAAAIASLVILAANSKMKILTYDATGSAAVILIVAFAAGYSERFILGAMDRISQIGK
jgi:hypothetical protein